MYRILIFSASKGIQTTIRGMKDARSARDELGKVYRKMIPGQYAKLQFTASCQLPWTTLETWRMNP